MQIKDLLKALAPTAATLIGGPLAGMAVSAIGEALGIDAPTQQKIAEAITGGQMTGEQLASMRQADNALKLKLAELGIRAEELDVEDRKSARDLQAQSKSRIPGALALLITMGFFGVLVGMMAGYLKPQENQALLILLGALAAAWGAVVNFYYGSSAGSQNKDALLARGSASR